MLINVFRRALSRPSTEAVFVCNLRPHPPLFVPARSWRGILGTRPLHASASRTRGIHSPESVNVEHSEWLNDSPGYSKESKNGKNLDSDDLEQIAEGKGT